MKHALLNRDFGDVQTVIVLGAGRGGTSVIAGCLRGLGVCMGIDPHMFKHEWSPIIRGSDDQVDLTATGKNIEMMNRDHKLWGWKSPRDAFVLEQVFPFLRNPGLIVVTRDLSDVACSSGQHQSIPFEIGFRETAEVYQLIADRIRFWPWPALVVAFGEVLKNGSDFVDLLCSFLNIGPNHTDKQRAASFIDPEANAYRRFDAAYREGPNVIPPEDLQVDARRAASHFIEQYSEQYIRGFEAMLEDTKRAAEILRGLSQPNDPGLVREVIENVQKLFSRFPEDDLRVLGLDWFSDSSTILNAATSGAEYQEIFDKLCDGLARAVQQAGQNIKATSLETTKTYGDLLTLHRLLQMLIRVRTELQRALQLNSLPRMDSNHE